MYKLLLILLALSNGVDLAVLSSDRACECQNDQSGNSTEAESPSSTIERFDDSRYQTDQQTPYTYDEPQKCCKVIHRDDYVITPDVGAFKLHTRKLTWNQARKFCIEGKGHLAILNSLREEEVLLNWMQKENISHAWLGVHDQFEEGDWVTLFGDTLESSGYNKWTTVWPNQPDNYAGYQNCGVLKTEGGLDDVRCNSTFPFFCEIELCSI